MLVQHFSWSIYNLGNAVGWTRRSKYEGKINKLFNSLHFLLKVFVCRPLHESSYTIVGKLLDYPGIIYREKTQNGIFADLLTSNDQKIKPFINTSLAEVLVSCENKHPAYPTFQIENLLDLKNTLDYNNYLELDRAFSVKRYFIF